MDPDRVKRAPHVQRIKEGYGDKFSGARAKGEAMIAKQTVTMEEMLDVLRILKILVNRAPRCFENREAIGLSDNKSGPILKQEIRAIRSALADYFRLREKVEEWKKILKHEWVDILIINYPELTTLLMILQNIRDLGEEKKE